MTAITRRQLLARIGAAGVLGAVGIGAAVAAITDLAPRIGPARPSDPVVRPVLRPPTPAPAELTAAWERELKLIATLDVALPAEKSFPRLAAIRADHRAHAAALSAAIAAATGDVPTTRVSPTAPSVTMTARSAAAPTNPQLRAAEQAAQKQAGAESRTLRGAAAVLLASIAACEAGHVELLT